MKNRGLGVYFILEKKMKRPIVLGFVFVIAGVACIFPFIRALVLENIAVMLGVYLIYRGYLYLTEPEYGKHKFAKKSHDSAINVEESPSDCKK